MHDCLTADELMALGFSAVGEGVTVSKDARLFAISGTLGDRVRIDAFAVLTGSIHLGQGVHISPFCFLGGTGGTITMGDHSGMSTRVSIFTKSDDYTSVAPHPDKVVGNVTIGEKTVIGSGCTILPGVAIGASASISCNCVVTTAIEAGSIVVGRSLGLLTVASRGTS